MSSMPIISRGLTVAIRVFTSGGIFTRRSRTLHRSFERWFIDFVSDQFFDGRRFRILAVADDCTRECLALVADTSISGLRVAPELAGS